jgi:hypothetical protein
MASDQTTRLYAGAPPSRPHPKSAPFTTVPTSTFRVKVDGDGRVLKFQQLHNDPRGGDRRYWLDVPEVPWNASDVE